MNSVIPEKLFILDITNNHMGDLKHALKIVKEFGAICQAFPFNFAFKLEYRWLDSLIHPEYKTKNDNECVKRLAKSQLTRDNMRPLIEAIKLGGFVTICSPLDEASVEHALEDEFDMLAMDSASFADWMLLERLVLTQKPVICSTAGASLDEIDNVVSFLEHRSKSFALMHCVAEYPTKPENMQLNQIDFLKSRYPHVRLGIALHEHRGKTMSLTMAIAKHCTIFEKHVGVPTDKYGLNDYSDGLEEVRDCLSNAEKAFAMMGETNQRAQTTETEKATLSPLRRGLFAARDIASGEMLRNEDVFLAMPSQDKHVTAREWSKYNRFYAEKPIKSGEPILSSTTRKECVRDKVLGIVVKVTEMLRQGNVVIPNGTKLEISHHYGLDKFYDYGAALLTIINREYCKKVIVVLPGQKHPTHCHKTKDETLHVLHGNLTVTLNGVTKDYSVGEMIVVEPNAPHSFESVNGAVFEEISSTHLINDSFYSDPLIGGYSDRKTHITYWNVLSQLDLEKQARPTPLSVK
jgi:sialic acid synthase SpsE/mannose-6-phosphate isomerase-like protein (cupin superfamily)